MGIVRFCTLWPTLELSIYFVWFISLYDETSTGPRVDIYTVVTAFHPTPFPVRQHVYYESTALEAAELTAEIQLIIVIHTVNSLFMLDLKFRHKIHFALWSFRYAMDLVMPSFLRRFYLWWNYMMIKLIILTMGSFTGMTLYHVSYICCRRTQSSKP